jgi:hypothetical protein
VNRLPVEPAPRESSRSAESTRTSSLDSAPDGGGLRRRT